MTNYHDIEKWLNWVDELSERNYVVIDDFLDDQLYTVIRNYFLAKLEDFEQAGIGADAQHQVITGIRGDRTYWLDSERDTSLRTFWSLVNEVIWVLNRYCYLSLSAFEFHLAHYPPGGYYDRHLDQFQGRNNRLISVVIYLNEGWKNDDGGKLELIDSHGEAQQVDPIGKRCVLFKSADVPHAVLTSKRSRYSLTGWLMYHPSSICGLLA